MIIIYIYIYTNAVTCDLPLSTTKYTPIYHTPTFIYRGLQLSNIDKNPWLRTANRILNTGVADVSLGTVLQLFTIHMYTLHPLHVQCTVYVVHLTPYTLHPTHPTYLTPYTCTRYTLHTLHPTHPTPHIPYSLHLTSYTLHTFLLTHVHPTHLTLGVDVGYTEDGC